MISGALVLCTLLTACFSKTEEDTSYILRVGDRKITAEQLKKDLKSLTTGLELPEFFEKRPGTKLLDSLIEYYLIQEYADQNGLQVDDNELELVIQGIKKDYPEDAFNRMLLETYTDLNQWKDKVRYRLLVTKVFDQVTKAVDLPTLADIKQHYNAHLKEYKTPRQVKFRQIVTYSKEIAMEALKGIEEGQDFEAMARKYSVAPEAQNGGLVGWISKDELDPSMDNVLFSLPVGKISSIIKTPYGYHIFQIISVRSPGIRPIDEVFDEIQSKLYAKKREMFFERWLKELRSQTNIRFSKILLSRLEEGAK